LLDRRFALLTSGGGALLADLAQGEVRWEIDAPTRSACFDHRRHWLALGATGRVSVWDLRSLQLLHEGEADAGPLTALAFHPLEPLLLSASTSGHAILWRLGDKAAQALAVFHAHDAEITSLAFCPDGRYFASAATDRSLRLWRTLDRSVRDELGGTSVVEALAFTPDNQLLLAAARNRSVRVFNVTDGNLLHSVADPHSSAVEALAIASNGELAASGTSNGMCLVWHTQSGQIEAQFQSTPEGVRALSFTPDGTELATLENDQRMRLWSLARGTVHTELALHNTATLAMQFSQNGRQLALGARDGSTTIWALGANQSPLQRFEGQGAPVVGVHFTAHGGALLSVTTAGILRRDLLQEGSGTLARLVGGGTKLVAFSPDGTFLAGSAGDNGVQIWRLSDVWHEGARQPWQTVRNTGQVQSLSFSPDSQILAIVCEDGVRLWQRVDPQAVRAELLVADPGAQRAAIDHGGSLIAWSNTDGRIVLSTLNSGQVLQTVSSGGRGVRSLCFAPDNNRLFAGRQDGRVEIWAINEQASSGGREDRRRSRSGRRLTNLTDLGANVRRAPQLTTTLEAHAAAIEQILLHPSGEAFATTSADGTTRLWRA
jgi:WD40 repeat protein